MRDRTKGESRTKRIRLSTKHVKRAMCFAITDDVDQGISQ
jgi:hypothetical protein